jgi:hypothetical protein
MSDVRNEQPINWPAELDDPVLNLMLAGRAATLDDAEELYLDESMGTVLELIGGPLSNDELVRQPLMKLLLARGMRGREDSLL